MSAITWARGRAGGSGSATRSAGRWRGSAVSAAVSELLTTGAGGGLLAKIGAGCGPDCRNSALTRIVTVPPVAISPASESTGRRSSHVAISRRREGRRSSA